MIPLSEAWRTRLMRLLNKFNLIWCPKCGARVVVTEKKK